MRNFVAYYIMGNISGMQDDSPAKTVDSVYKMYIISGKLLSEKVVTGHKKGEFFA